MAAPFPRTRRLDATFLRGIVLSEQGGRVLRNKTGAWGRCPIRSSPWTVPTRMRLRAWRVCALGATLDACRRVGHTTYGSRTNPLPETAGAAGSHMRPEAQRGNPPAEVVEQICLLAPVALCSAGASFSQGMPPSRLRTGLCREKKQRRCNPYATAVQDR